MAVWLLLRILVLGLVVVLMVVVVLTVDGIVVGLVLGEEPQKAWLGRERQRQSRRRLDSLGRPLRRRVAGRCCRLSWLLCRATAMTVSSSSLMLLLWRCGYCCSNPPRGRGRRAFGRLLRPPEQIHPAHLDRGVMDAALKNKFNNRTEQNV
jgi:hypothetical protein